MTTGSKTNVHHVADTFAQRATDKAEELATTVKEGAQDAAAIAKEKGQMAADEAQRVAKSAYASTKQFVEEQPVLAIAGAAAVCFIAGALWKASRNRRGTDMIDRLQGFVEPHYRSLRSKL